MGKYAHHGLENPVNLERDMDDYGAGPVPLPSPSPEVDVWLCGLTRSDEHVRAMARSLSAAETARAGRFGRPELRDRYIVGRATLRALLAQRIGIASAEVVIRRGERGRPYTDQATGLDFNVSHTQRVALFGITTGRRIGVDIEHGERIVNVDGVARKFMSQREQAELQALPPDDRRRALLRLWTCKEAMSKATGDALSAPFRCMEVAADADLRLQAGPAPYLPHDWRLLPVAVPGGYLATAALWHGPRS